MEKYIMALDAGTTSNRCIIFDRNGRPVASAQKEFTQIFPKPGFVEHDADEIYLTMYTVAKLALNRAGLDASQIAGIGITNQRETTICFDKVTGKPVYNAIVWQCRRTSGYCDELKAHGYENMIREKTGLIIDPYFSATKVRWILENVDGAAKLAKEGRLLFGTVETWLIYKLSGGRLHVTDYSNASRTMMFNIHTLTWDEEILDLMGIPASMLPKVVDSSTVYGMTDSSVFGVPVPIAGAAGDQQAALFGQKCFREGEIKNTYGTGCFLLMNTGDKPVVSKNNLITTIAWGINGKVTYAMEGSIFVGGAAIQWLRDELGLIDNAAQSAELARKVGDTAGCYVVPAFTGLGAPYWDQYARGVITGLTRGVNKNHIVRATLESIAYQVHDVVRAMEQDSGIRLKSLNVDGGASANDFLMQFQSDILTVKVNRPACVETTALGAAYLAGLATGFYEGIEEIRTQTLIDRTFAPVMDKRKANDKLKGWKKALERSKDWEDHE